MAKVDELNRLYNSRDPNDIIKFYDNFNTPEELIEWSRNRPHGRAKIYTVRGDTDIVVVIPTADRHGEYAKNCENEIFKGQQIVFVESGGRGDPYFNYARNCNIGLKYALRYKPKWVILSNDDVYKIDDFLDLSEKLKILSPAALDSVFISAEPDNYHSFLLKVVKRNALSKFINKIFKLNPRYSEKLLDKFGVKYVTISNRIGLKKRILRPLLRFIEYPLPTIKTINIGDFGIFSSKFLKTKKFDEVFINDYEDVDLSLQIKKYCKIKFRLGSKRGTILGQNEKRNLMDVISNVYFNYKILSMLKSTNRRKR